MKKKNYELTFLLSPELTGQEVENFFKEVEGFVSKIGELGRKEKPKKIRLKYPIAEKQETFLGSLVFKAEANKINSLKEEIEKNKSLLRYLLVKKEEIRDESKEVAEKKQPPIFTKRFQRAAGFKPIERGAGGEVKEKKKVEMKEVEEKLEKIV